MNIIEQSRDTIYARVAAISDELITNVLLFCTQSDMNNARVVFNFLRCVYEESNLNLQPYTTSQEIASLRSPIYLIDGRCTAQTYTTMRLIGIEQYLTAHRYQAKSLFLSYEKRLKQYSLKSLWHGLDLLKW